ncbi:Prolyl 4-hydroxylase 5 [Cytospora mali]|uniref:Prolyl 4-hydroxylase 5 n=1 Tax=Cytospora mali TaxID=578113 RepID=A0A194VN79_CYTMA|nr:Prolyl 4-hydroxylase 5 [Valsa mali]
MTQLRLKGRLQMQFHPTENAFLFGPSMKKKTSHSSKNEIGDAIVKPSRRESRMLSYAVAVLVFIILYNPIIQFLSPAPLLPQVHRTPRPRVNESLLALEEANGTAAALQCPEDSYSVHIFSKEPLVVYIENFLPADERAHLLEISEPTFEPSTITHDGGAATQRDQTVRDSEVAVIPRTDVVKCIEARARAFQGWREEMWIERLRTQRYHPGGHYSHHFDWSSSRGGWGRVSSFMAWVDGSASDDGGGDGGLVGGGTEFPLLRRLSPDDRWCRFMECDNAGGGGKREDVVRDAGADGAEDATAAAAAAAAAADSSEGDQGQHGSTGAVFKPIAGNAVYWENFRPDGTGRGWDETWHAGLPVEKGVKVGLNIWTWGRID